MKLPRSFLTVSAAFALVVPLAGCNGRGPDAFYPGTVPGAAPAQRQHACAGRIRPIPVARVQRRGAQATRQSAGPQPRP